MKKLTRKKAKKILLAPNPFEGRKQKTKDLHERSFLKLLFTEPKYVVWLMNKSRKFGATRRNYQNIIRKGIEIMDSMPVVVNCSVCNNEVASYMFMAMSEDNKEILFANHVCSSSSCLVGRKDSLPHNASKIIPISIEAICNIFKKRKENDRIVRIMKAYMGFSFSDLHEFNEKAYLEYILDRAEIVL